MKLTEYIEQRKIRRSDFAARVDVSESFLSRLLSGKRTPGARLIARIEEETGGDVAFRDWTLDGLGTSLRNGG